VDRGIRITALQTPHGYFATRALQDIALAYYDAIKFTKPFFYTVYLQHRSQFIEKMNIENVIVENHYVLFSILSILSSVQHRSQFISLMLDSRLI